MRFSKEKFMSNAPKNIKKTLKNRLNILNNMYVDFSFDNEYGTIEYEFQGEKEYLYPIDKKWCKEC